MKGKSLIKPIRDFITAVIIAVLIFYSMTLAAAGVVHTQVYRQSRVVSMLIQQDASSVKSMFEDRRVAGMLIKFAGALTKAYIDFELIPVNEPVAFVEIFESLPDNIVVESFEYSRRDLYITGSAKSENDYLSFRNALQARNYFASVNGSSYESTRGGVQFEIICASNAVETYLTF